MSGRPETRPSRRPITLWWCVSRIAQERGDSALLGVPRRAPLLPRTPRWHRTTPMYTSWSRSKTVVTVVTFFLSKNVFLHLLLLYYYLFIYLFLNLNPNPHAMVRFCVPDLRWWVPDFPCVELRARAVMRSVRGNKVEPTRSQTGSERGSRSSCATASSRARATCSWTSSTVLAATGSLQGPRPKNRAAAGTKRGCPLRSNQPGWLPT